MSLSEVPAKGLPMLIRLGYEIAIESAQDLPVISLLDIRPERRADIKRQTPVLTTPKLGSRTYRDLFGNLCRRFMVPAGSFSILYDALVEDDGAPDAIAPEAAQVPVDELPDAALGFLLGSRSTARPAT